ncbi:MAG: helix-turn-helix domain-containing protein [Chloroflexota bacterium]|nr:helix-turn-helix domain-containing protein [Chloroflexota bacterium]
MATTYDVSGKRPRRLLTTREASEYLHVHPNTVRGWCERGILPNYRVGPHHNRKFKLEDIQAFLEKEINGISYDPDYQ